MGMGRAQARRGRGLGGTYKRGNVWWIWYYFRGKLKRETSGSEVEKVALDLLKKRHSEMVQGRLVGPDAERVVLKDLHTMVQEDYVLKENKTVARVDQCMEHVFEILGEDTRALDITTDRLRSYAATRLEDGAKHATVKQELAHLRRGYNLAVDAKRLPERPRFPTI